MAKHRKDWNMTPTNPYATDDEKGKEFDAQYAQNKQAGEQKEQARQERPEPKGHRRG